MRRRGNREFGVYVPPSGEDSVRYSTQIDLALVSKLNNVEFGEQLRIQSSIKDPNQGSVERSNQVGFGLINRVNTISKRFDEMIRQGWGGNIVAPYQSPSPSPSPSPSLAPTSFPSLPFGNLKPRQIDRAMPYKAANCTEICTTLYNTWNGQSSVQRVCWRLGVGWKSDVNFWWQDSLTYNSLFVWWRDFFSYDTGHSDDYFTVDDATRVCFPLVSSSPPSTLPPGEFDASDIDAAMALW